ncbi:ricin-type beta-trefoil lectin domain protein [Streptomyces sp. NPDC097727]|uniref:ricin-type beta-trefoil lectin domain protein n=1 Tax=Streptomyces sp. NPDC097727 TaxID=3366092 RepID=UPI003829A842
MRPPHTPRSARDLPKRVPGSAKKVSPSSAPARDETAADGAGPTAPTSGDQAAGSAGRDTSLPRLTQFSSLGSRRNTGGSRAAAGASADGSTGNGKGTGDGFGHRGEAGRAPAADSAVPPDPSGRHTGDKARREGFRGALGVVGTVGLLAAVGLLLVLGLVNHDDGQKHTGASVVVDSDDHGTDAVEGLGRPSGPSAGPSGSKGAKEAGRSTKPTSAASPGSGAPARPSAAPGEHATAPAEDKPRTKASAPVSTPGVGVFSHASQRCIDVVGGKPVQGARLMIQDCSGASSQHWVFTGGTMRGLGMCVQLAGGSTDDGTDVELASCNGSAAQRFTLNIRHDLVSALADKCTDVRDNRTDNGTRLQLWSCSGSPNQKWSKS